MSEPMIKPLHLKSVGEIAAEAIIRELEAKAGGRFHIDFCCVDDVVRYQWRYDCPCGEVSGYMGAIPWMDIDRMKEEDVPRYVRYHVDTALECMRRHVRSEGNEPGF